MKKFESQKKGKPLTESLEPVFDMLGPQKEFMERVERFSDSYPGGSGSGFKTQPVIIESLRRVYRTDDKLNDEGEKNDERN